jgi:mRNA interferase HigB
VDFLKSGKTVFNIGGNKYRVVVLMMYEWGKVLVRYVLTHKEYDHLNNLGKL